MAVRYGEPHRIRKSAFWYVYEINDAIRIFSGDDKKGRAKKY